MTEFKKGAGALLVTSDFHIHPYKGESKDGGRDRLTDGFNVLVQSLDTARQLRCPWVSLGDFKMPTRVWPVDVLTGYLHIMSAYPDVPKLMVPGNHDGDSDGISGLRPFAEVATVVMAPKVFESWPDTQYKVLKLPPLAVWPNGADWATYPAFLDQARKVGAQILLSHLYLLGAKLGPDEVRIPGQGHLVDKLGVGPKGPFVLGLFGDIHKGQVWRPRPPRPPEWTVGLPASVDTWGGTALYPGSPYMQSWGEREDGTKGFLYIDLAAGTLSLKASDAPRFVLLDLSTHTRAELDKMLKDADQRTFHGDFVRVVLPPHLTDQPGFLKRLFRAGEPRTQWVTQARVASEAESATRIDNFHAGLSTGELLEQYVQARPMPPEIKVSQEQLLAAGKRLLDEETPS